MVKYDQVGIPRNCLMKKTGRKSRDTATFVNTDPNRGIDVTGHFYRIEIKKL
jgi:hypothetical protein